MSPSWRTTISINLWDWMIIISLYIELTAMPLPENSFITAEVRSDSEPPLLPVFNMMDAELE